MTTADQSGADGNARKETLYTPRITRTEPLPSDAIRAPRVA